MKVQQSNPFKNLTNSTAASNSGSQRKVPDIKSLKEQIKVGAKEGAEVENVKKKSAGSECSFNLTDEDAKPTAPEEEEDDDRFLKELEEENK